VTGGLYTGVTAASCILVKTYNTVSFSSNIPLSIKLHTEWESKFF